MNWNDKYFTVAELKSLSWLVHGFGLAGFCLEHLSLEPELGSFQPVVMKQLHSSQVFCVDRKPDKTLAGDGLITASPGLLLIIKTADCLPIFLVDAENRVVAAIHCGWRSTSQKILRTVLNLMQQKFGSRTEHLLAVFGPCIEKKCYEVGSEVSESFSAAGFEIGRIFSPAPARNKFFLDLREANRWLLIEELGLRAQNIHHLNDCTFCQPYLHSYRRDRRTEQRLINFIGIRSRF